MEKLSLERLPSGRPLSEKQHVCLSLERNSEIFFGRSRRCDVRVEMKGEALCLAISEVGTCCVTLNACKPYSVDIVGPGECVRLQTGDQCIIEPGERFIFNKYSAPTCSFGISSSVSREPGLISLQDRVVRAPVETKAVSNSIEKAIEKSASLKRKREKKTEKAQVARAEGRPTQDTFIVNYHRSGKVRRQTYGSLQKIKLNTALVLS